MEQFSLMVKFSSTSTDSEILELFLVTVRWCMLPYESMI